MPTLEQLGIDRLTTAERLALVQEILDSIAADQPRPPLSDAERQELDRQTARFTTLADLLAGITPDNLHGEWAPGPPVGAEVL